jgi:hypothetical protein
VHPHKRRNVTDHLPEPEWGRVDAKLARAFNHPDPAAGLRAARDLQARDPEAAASLREGLEQLFTVRRHGVADRLARTLTSTNPLESMITITQTTTRNVKRWQDGQMVCRWMAAGMLAAERSFRQVTGRKDMPLPMAGLAAHTEEVTVTTAAEAARPGRHRTSTTSGTSSLHRGHPDSALRCPVRPPPARLPLAVPANGSRSPSG